MYTYIFGQISFVQEGSKMVKIKGATGRKNDRPKELPIATCCTKLFGNFSVLISQSWPDLRLGTIVGAGAVLRLLYRLKIQLEEVEKCGQTTGNLYNLSHHTHVSWRFSARYIEDQKRWENQNYVYCSANPTSQYHLWVPPLMKCWKTCELVWSAGRCRQIRCSSSSCWHRLSVNSTDSAERRLESKCKYNLNWK